jgi:hypothetical protein
MNNFEIKITGSGSKDELIAALGTVLSDLKVSSEQELASAEWEDETLMTEISTKEVDEN